MKKSILSMLAIAAIAFTSCTKEDEKIETPSSTFVANAADLKGDITNGTVTLNPAETYKLTGALVVKSGATLTIPAGTRIETDATASSTSLYIAVEKGAKINVNGTAANPVVMTSGKTIKAQSDWGGLVICGNGVTNLGTDVTSEVAGLTYGGTDNNDNSGSLTYLRMEYTGAAFNASKEFNGISLFAVGKGTTINNIYLKESGDDGIEFFGGDVDASNLYIENSYDDSLDFADGYTGSITNVYITGVSKAGIEGSNNGTNTAATPLTDVTITNVTVVKGASTFTASEQVVNFKEGGGKQKYVNMYVDGFSTFAKLSTDADAVARMTAGDFKVEGFESSNASITKNGASFSGATTATGAGNGSAKPTWANWII